MLPIPIDATFVTETLQQLVQTNSTSPSLSPDGAGERAIAHLTADIMDSLDLEVTLTEVAPKRWNVVGRLPGSGNGRTLLFNAHLDTVGVSGMAEPFSGALRDGKVYGRGSYDMKAGLAAQLGAAKGLRDAGIGLEGDLLVTAVADEEDKSIGMEHLVKHVNGDAAIVTEPTDLQLCRAHRGFIWFDVKTFGRAAHGSRFQEGIDANMRMGRFLAQLDHLERAVRRYTPHPLAGPPSLHASILQGGSEISVYAAECLLKMERRIIPGETVEQCTAELKAIIDQLTMADETFKATVEATFVREPFAIEENAEIVQTVAQSAQDVLGTPIKQIGQTFWTDAALLADSGIETVIIGPKGAGLHSAEEWVDVQSVVDLSHILAKAATTYCGVS